MRYSFDFSTTVMNVQFVKTSFGQGRRYVTLSLFPIEVRKVSPFLDSLPTLRKGVRNVLELVIFFEKREVMAPNGPEANLAATTQAENNAAARGLLPRIPVKRVKVQDTRQ